MLFIESNRDVLAAVVGAPRRIVRPMTFRRNFGQVERQRLTAPWDRMGFSKLCKGKAVLPVSDHKTATKTMNVSAQALPSQH